MARCRTGATFTLPGGRKEEIYAERGRLVTESGKDVTDACRDRLGARAVAVLLASRKRFSRDYRPRSR